MGDLDVGILLCAQPQHAHRRLAPLGISQVEEVVVQPVSQVLEQLACGQQGVDAVLRVRPPQAVGLVLVARGVEAVIVGGHGNHLAAHHLQHDAKVAPRRAVVLMVHREVVIQHHAPDVHVLPDLVAHDDGARHRHATAVGVE